MRIAFYAPPHHFYPPHSNILSEIIMIHFLFIATEAYYRNVTLFMLSENIIFLIPRQLKFYNYNYSFSQRILVIISLI